MRVVTLNIKHEVDVAGKIHLEALGEKLALLDADVVCLQEVDVGVERSGSVNQAEFLAMITQRTPIFLATVEYGGGLYGISMLIRKSPISIVQVSLPQLSPLSEPRKAMMVELSHNVGVANVHLSRNVEEAEIQVRWLDEYLPSWVTILGGDFNLSLERLTLKATEWTSVFAPGQEPLTWPATGPQNSLDHVFVRKQNWMCICAETYAVFPTDHLAIVADLQQLV